jgi:hypothetical protein
MTLTELAERCAKATGPDRTIDGLIFAHLNPNKRIIIGNKPGPFPQDPEYGTPLDIIGMAEADGSGFAQYLGALDYTASLDAAMTLVPEQYKDDWLLCENGAFLGPDSMYWAEGQADHYAYAATPVLALCAAALKACAASADTYPKDGDVEQAPLVSGAVPEGQTPND